MNFDKLDTFDKFDKFDKFEPSPSKPMGTTTKEAICGICPAGCWVEVGLDEGRLTSIRAQEGHPLGMICQRGEHSADIIYSEKRLQYPMRRVGPKGTHEFERIS